MTRKKVIIEERRDWKCQVCARANISGKKSFGTAFGLARHLAQKWDKPHEDWRIEHGFPARCVTLSQANIAASQILPLIQSWKATF